MSKSTTGAPRARSPMGWRRFGARAAGSAMRLSLKVSPRPMAWVSRRQSAKTEERRAASLRGRAPADVAAVTDERYGDHRDAVLDVYTPDAAQVGRRLPTVVWTHGGGFVGGSKDTLDYYLRAIAAGGFTVVGVNYALAPGARYPTPVRQVMAALRHLQANADRLHVDPAQLVLAGESAGAQISAQVAAIVTNPGYGEQVGVASTITAEQLRGVALCCGFYDLTRRGPSPFSDFVYAWLWAYSGIRDYASDEHFVSTMSVTTHVTERFPPAFITVGNADPLVAHSRALVEALVSKGVEVDTLLYPKDHQPPLGHAYHLELGLDEAGTALRRMLAFFRRHTNAET